MNNNLIERLKGFIIAYEEELSEDPYGRGLIEEAIAALSPPLPEDVQHALEWLGEFNQESDDVREMRNLIQRLAHQKALKQAVQTANIELDIPLHEEYCPHGAKWGECPQCP